LGENEPHGTVYRHNDYKLTKFKQNRYFEITVTRYYKLAAILKLFISPSLEGNTEAIFSLRSAKVETSDIFSNSTMHENPRSQFIKIRIQQ
jgi:hypothetical protein